MISNRAIYSPALSRPNSLTGREPELSGLRATMPPLIVHVDDHSDLIELIKYLLISHEGYRVNSFARGDQAIDFCRVNRPDLLITDLQHSNMDGWAMLEAIRTDRKLSDLPVIVFTGRSGCANEIEAMGATYIPKPCDWHEFIATVRGVVG